MTGGIGFATNMPFFGMYYQPGSVTVLWRMFLRGLGLLFEYVYCMTIFLGAVVSLLVLMHWFVEYVYWVGM